MDSPLPDSNQPIISEINRRVISEDDRRKHEASAREFPTLSLSEGEYVVKVVDRHWIGILESIALVSMSVVLVMALASYYPLIIKSIGYRVINYELVVAAAMGISVLFIIGGLINVFLYLRSRLILTNESVIQELQRGFFSRTEQTVSLDKIEDIGYLQDNFLQILLNYGSIDLTIVGDKHTYHYNRANNPKEAAALINNASEKFNRFKMLKK